ncbi:hypothetical protein ILFOPFJJ_06585 [Ensifer psoraleae]|nr:hypothetical protein [Sinorhizobium psoraleae]
MLQTYVQSPNGPIRPAARGQRKAGPSTAAARAEHKSDAPQQTSNGRKLGPNTKALGELMKRVIVGSVTPCLLTAPCTLLLRFLGCSPCVS